MDFCAVLLPTVGICANLKYPFLASFASQLRALCPTASHICTVRMFFVFAHKLWHFMGRQDEISVCTFVAKVFLIWNPHKRDCLIRWTIFADAFKVFLRVRCRLHIFEITSTLIMKVLPETLLTFASSLVDFMYCLPHIRYNKKIR